MREQPDNPAVRQYLYGAYQQKAVLLATAIDRSYFGGPMNARTISANCVSAAGAAMAALCC